MQKDGKQKNPTIIDVARESGVSYSTVSRALNGYEFVKASTRERVVQAAEKLGYVPNQQARSLAGGRSNLIGVLVPGLGNGYIDEIIRGIDEELAMSDYNLILYTTHRYHGKESTYVASIMNGAADGLLLVVPLTSESYLEALRRGGFPYVLVDQSDDTARSFTVNAANWQGAYDAAKYLIDLGHRRIGFIRGLMPLSSSTQRQEGFMAALNDHGIALEDDYIVDGEFQQHIGYIAGQQLLALSERPTAIFASNDLSAFGAIEAIREIGLRIPDDISVMGFDDIAQAAVTYPKLTTVRQPLNQMGRVGVQLLLQHIENPNVAPCQETVPTQLIIRDSCQALDGHHV